MARSYFATCLLKAKTWADFWNWKQQWHYNSAQSNDICSSRALHGGINFQQGYLCWLEQLYAYLHTKATSVSWSMSIHGQLWSVPRCCMSMILPQADSSIVATLIKCYFSPHKAPCIVQSHSKWGRQNPQSTVTAIFWDRYLRHNISRCEHLRHQTC